MARDILRGGACVPGVVALVPSLASKKARRKTKTWGRVVPSKLPRA